MHIWLAPDARFLTYENVNRTYRRAVPVQTVCEQGEDDADRKERVLHQQPHVPEVHEERNNLPSQSTRVKIAQFLIVLMDKPLCCASVEGVQAPATRMHELHASTNISAPWQDQRQTVLIPMIFFGSYCEYVPAALQHSTQTARRLIHA
jgi:hypothetical protein